MKLKVFSVYDTKAEAFNTPFFMQNKAMALRSFSDLAKDEKTTIYRHPKDYQLFEIGEFDDNTGMLESVKPVNLGFPILDPEVIDMRKLMNKDGKQLELPAVES